MNNEHKRNNIKGILSFVLLFLIFILFVLCNILVFYSMNTKADNSGQTVSKVSDDTIASDKVNLNEFCVEIYVKGKNDKNYNIASGTVISEDGYIVTNDHIYKDLSEPEFLIKFNDGNCYNASYIGGDIKSDIALLKVDINNLNCPEIYDSDKCEKGENISILGNIFYEDLGFTLTSGVISHTNRYINDNGDYSIKLFQFDASVNPGFSGGPVFNSENKLIGITNCKLNVEGYESIGFCIPINTVVEVAEEIKKFGAVISRGKLGISYIYIKENEAIMFNEVSGLRINDIELASSFFNSGIEKNDVIRSINSIEVSDDYKFLDILNNLKYNQDVELVIRKTEGNDVVIKGKSIKLNSKSSFYSNE